MLRSTPFGGESTTNEVTASFVARRGSTHVYEIGGGQIERSNETRRDRRAQRVAKEEINWYNNVSVLRRTHWPTCLCLLAARSSFCIHQLNFPGHRIQATTQSRKRQPRAPFLRAEAFVSLSCVPHSPTITALSRRDSC